MNSVKILIFLSFTLQVYGFFEVSITNGQPMVRNDNQIANLDKLRVKKLNKTGHYVIGEIDLFVELSNAYQVCRVEKFIKLNSPH